MTLFRRLCSNHHETLQSIIARPFNQQLLEGSLPKATYEFFVAQDKQYLVGYAKALQQIADRMENPRYAKQFEQLSQVTVEFEQSMLSSSGETHVTATSGQFFPPAYQTPVLKQYTNHLLQTTKHAHPCVAIAAILPCFWIYGELGKLVNLPLPDAHSYRDWIASYKDPEYIKSTDKLIQTFTDLTKDLTDPELIAEIDAAFKASVAYEDEFFVTCYVRHSSSNSRQYA